MNKVYFLLLAALIIAVVQLRAVTADRDEYHYLGMCDNRCEMKNRLNPFAEGCDNCCRQRGFKKGKCKGFGWQYCMCKPHGQIRQLFNSILNPGYQQNYIHG